MLTATLCSRRLFVPLVRSQFALHDVKSVLNGYASDGSHISGFKSRISCRLLQTSARHRVLSLKSPKPNSAHRFTFFRQQQLRSFISLPRRTGENEWESLLKLPLMQRFKVLFKKYWYIVVPLHIIISAAWFGLFWVTSMVLAKFGYETKNVILYLNPYIQDIRFMPDYIKKKFNEDPENLGHVAFTLLMCKLTSPLHYLSTIFATFYLLRFLLRAGIIVKSSSEISIIMKDSYFKHAIHKNIKRRAEAIKHRFKGHRTEK